MYVLLVSPRLPCQPSFWKDGHFLRCMLIFLRIQIYSKGRSLIYASLFKLEVILLCVILGGGVGNFWLFCLISDFEGSVVSILNTKWAY